MRRGPDRPGRAPVPGIQPTRRFPVDSSPLPSRSVSGACTSYYSGRGARSAGSRLAYNVVMIRVEQVLDSWRTIRQDTAAAVEDFPAGELDYRPTPEVATFREIARHVLDSSDGLIGLLLSGDNDLTAGNFRERLKPH